MVKLLSFGKRSVESTKKVLYLFVEEKTIFYLMSNTHKIRKGLNIRLKGKSELVFGDNNLPKTYSLKPTDFTGLIPKLKLKEGDLVKRGETIFYDKYQTDICFVSPVSGKIAEVVRGEKRKILEIIIESDDRNEPIKYDLAKYRFDNADDLKALLLNSGVWPFIKERPYGVLANPKETPRDIFITFFDSAPLAADYDFILSDKSKEINAALHALKYLTSGNIYLNFPKKSNLLNLIENKDNYKINFFTGPHPAGLVGVQINAIKPINKGDIVWTLKAADLQIIGALLLNGEYIPERVIAITGSEIEKPNYCKTIIGANFDEYLNDKLKTDNVRLISGNVLTGTFISHSKYLGFFDTQLTAIKEGNYYEMLGWALPGFKKLSASSTFASMLMPQKEFAGDTNLHGGLRAYVITGQYEKVCPIDIYPQLLIKAILAEDIDKMEQMGIYEIIEEDLALCEFVCTSKIEVQEILRKGLDLIRQEMQ